MFRCRPAWTAWMIWPVASIRSAGRPSARVNTLALPPGSAARAGRTAGAVLAGVVLPGVVLAGVVLAGAVLAGAVLAGAAPAGAALAGPPSRQAALALRSRPLTASLTVPSPPRVSTS